MSNLYSFRCGLIPNQLAGDPDSRFLNVEKSSACCSNDKRTVHTVAADSKVAEATQLLLGADKKFPGELQPPSRQMDASSLAW